MSGAGRATIRFWSRPVLAALAVAALAAGCAGSGSSQRASGSAAASASTSATASRSGATPGAPASVSASAPASAGESSSQGGSAPSGPPAGQPGYQEPEVPPVDTSQPQASDKASVQVSLAPVQTSGGLPGEIAGNGVAVTVSMTAATDLDLSAATVELLDSQGAPAVLVGSSDAEPLPATLAAGQSAQGVYVFTAPASGAVTVRVTADADSPVLVFTGTLP